MSSQTASLESLDLEVENVGGIEEAHLEIDPGVTILSGRNATNRTSMLQAIMAAMGSDRASLKADAEEGVVSLTVGEETYDRRLRREGGSLLLEGEPYLDEPEDAELFAFLLEDNEARRAVERGSDLRELIMRPVDTDAIQAEIQALTAEKRRLDERLDDLAEERRRLPDLEAERARLEDDLEEKRAELARTRTAIEDADGAIDASRDAKDELDEKLEELRATRSTLEEVRYDLETERESLTSLRAERDDLEEELDALPEAPAGALEEIEGKLDVLRERKRSISADVSQLQTIVQFNDDMLEGADTDLLEAVADGDGPEADASTPTDRLLEESQRLVCWTCGSEVQRDRVASIVEELQSLRSSKLEARTDVDERISELQAEQQELERQQHRREELRRTLERRTDEIEHTAETVEELEARCEELEAEIETLETTIEELEAEEYSELLEHHASANQLEFEIDRLEDDLESTQSEIESIEARLEERSDLEDERDEVVAGLQERRTRIDRTEQRAVESFNEHMDDVLTALEYENVERVWIERREREVREGRRTVSKRTFELHVVRETTDGEAYEDTVDHLSESEREVIGLVFALAGYLTHEVYETTPLMLLDSLEALDSERIEALVEYLREHVDSLVIALLEEDARAFAEADDVTISAF